MRVACLRADHRDLRGKKHGGGDELLGVRITTKGEKRHDNRRQHARCRETRELVPHELRDNKAGVAEGEPADDGVPQATASARAAQRRRGEGSGQDNEDVEADTREDGEAVRSAGDPVPLM